MVVMTNSLPEFERPPLNEVVLGVQFKPLVNFRVAHLGLYWSLIRDRYPLTEDKGPLAHVVEHQEIKPATAKAEVQFDDRAMPPRCWFLDSPGVNLIQLQHDRFVRNWRQVAGTEVYPRYATLSISFFDEWKGFVGFLEREQMPAPEINQCELTYVNHFEPGEHWDLSNLAGLLSFIRPRPPAFLKAPDFVGWTARYPIAGSQSAGHVKLGTAFRGRDLKMILVLNLTARGAPETPDEAGLRRWFDLAHEWIVRSFDELTDPSMHQLWGKIHG
jgi:uncharacterized protein (TIGR04255 family)